MLNKVILIGRMATDPELKYTPSGHAVSTFRVAVNRPVANAQGEREADFIDIVVWRQSAEFAANWLGKGRLVALEGRLQVRSYTTQAGEKRRVCEVLGDNLKALGRKPDHAREGAPAAGQGAGASASASVSDDPAAYDDPFQ